MYSTCQCLFSNTSQKAQLRAPLSPLQTAWTCFDPCLYSGGSSFSRPCSGGKSNCKIFYTQQGHCDWHNVCHTPGARLVSSAFHSTKAVVIGFLSSQTYSRRHHDSLLLKERWCLIQSGTDYSEIKIWWGSRLYVNKRLYGRIVNSELQYTSPSSSLSDLIQHLMFFPNLNFISQTYKRK